MTPQEKAKDRRLWKCYRWTLAMYNALGELQGWRCAGCGKHRDEKNLCLDHEHFRMDAYRIITDYPYPELKWVAKASFKDGRWFEEVAETKKAAIYKVKETALPYSVRGLLCQGRYGLGCNTKLGRADDPVWLGMMIRYLIDPPAKKILKENK